MPINSNTSSRLWADSANAIWYHKLGNQKQFPIPHTTPCEVQTSTHFYLCFWFCGQKQLAQVLIDADYTNLHHWGEVSSARWSKSLYVINPVGQSLKTTFTFAGFVKLTPCSESQMFEESNTFQSMNENPVSPGRPSSSTMTAGAGNGEDSTNSSKWKSFLRVATSPKIVSTKSSSTSEKSFKGFKYPLRVNSSTHSVSRQRRIVSMLFVVVLEFFVCWTPIFIVDTLSLYRPDVVYGKSRNVSQWIEIDIISACHLLCFCSSCTNPVTYCFMNRRFRRHFMVLFRCRNETTGGEKRLPRATIESECGKPRETCVHYRDGKKQRK